MYVVAYSSILLRVYISFSVIPTSVQDENMMYNINFSDTNDIGIASEDGDAWLHRNDNFMRKSTYDPGL